MTTPDRVDRKTRGLLAIAISDAIQERGLRPVSPILVSLRRMFRLEMPRSGGDLVAQVGAARRGSSMALGCVGVLAILILPILLPIEWVRGRRVRRHNHDARQKLGASLPGPAGGYRDDAGSGGGGAVRTELLRADQVLAIDWTIWRDGAVCFAGAALGVVRGNDRLVQWLIVHRASPPRDTIDAAALARSLPELAVESTRWEWELDDPFEAWERE